MVISKPDDSGELQTMMRCNKMVISEPSGEHEIQASYALQ